MSKDATTSAAVPFLDLLREQTADAHAELESLPVSSSLMHAKVNLESYQIYLTLMLDIWMSAEAHVYPAVQKHFTNFKIQPKSDTIIFDLSQTGFKQNHVNTELFSFATAKSEAYAMGIMYVLEGSTLGGRMIYKHINKKLNLDESTGACFFAGYGGQTGSMWKVFLDDLKQYERDNNQTEEIIIGAIDAFKIIHNRFAEVRL